MSDHYDDGGEVANEQAEAPVPAIVPAKASFVHRTPTEAKADAVGALLAKAVEKASELRLTPEETESLKAEFPDEAFRPGAAGKDNLIYIEHSHLRDRLDNALGIGQAVIVPLGRWTETFTYIDRYKNEQTAHCVYVEAALIVRGCYVTQAVGDMTYYAGNAAQNYGDAVEGAETAAFRRCAKKFGVGLQAWSKSWCEGWWRRKGTQTPTNQHTPEADSFPDQPHGSLPLCLKCGNNNHVIVGKPEYGGGFVCFKKKGGCGAKWGGKDVRTGEDAEPQAEQPSILEGWKKMLDPETVGIDQLNGEITTMFKGIPGKHPERAKVWKLILDYAKANGAYFNHGSRCFAFADEAA